MSPRYESGRLDNETATPLEPQGDFKYTDADAFARHVADLAPVFVAPPGGSGEFARPAGWQHSAPDHNDTVLRSWRPGWAICAVTGDQLAVVDVDPRNGGDTAKVRQLLDGLGVRVFAEVATPGGGRHFYVAGHPDLMTCHDLTEWPGVDVQSHGANVYLPGTVRAKYPGKRYTVTYDNLPALGDGGDPEGAEALAYWVGEHRAAAMPEPFAVSPPWNGAPHDDRQAAYLSAVLEGQADEVTRAGVGNRNTTVYTAALKCGSYIAGAGLDERTVTDTLLGACIANGLAQDDGEPAVLSTIRSGIRNGKRQPRAVPPDRNTVTLLDTGMCVDVDTGEVVDRPDAEVLSKTRDRFPRLDLAALLKADRPAREWVVDGLIPAGASVALVAPAGQGKSLLLLAMMLGIARGDATFAALTIAPRRVLLVDMENTEDDLADRIRALGVTDENVHELFNLVPIHLPPLPPLDTPQGAQDLAAILDAYDVRAGDVVVLDSLQRVIAGAENDSDTMRAFYRHTAVMLKRRGVTVVRTDNTGKDTDKGARGTSGKRDDVDVELILKADAQKVGRLYLKPGKVRLPGIRSLIVQQEVDHDGLLTYSTTGDPFRAAVAEAVAVLDDLGLPDQLAQRPGSEAIKRAGHKVSREVLRTAIGQRQRRATTLPRTP
jgi:archaellum biogenesis ATPase FlaH